MRPGQESVRLAARSRASAAAVAAAAAAAGIAALVPAGAPAVIPGDRGRIAFERAGHIFTAAPEGGGLRQVTSGTGTDSSPAWSPTGGEIAFVRRTGGNSDIWVADADGTDARRLTRSAADDQSPAWAPDGSRLAFSSTRDGNAEIYTMRPDGSDVARVTRSAAADVDPDWSPDGTRIAFATSDGGRILAAFLDGTDPVDLIPEASGAAAPAWSPGGNEIAYETQGGIDVAAVGGGSPHRLAASSPGDRVPAWSPDGGDVIWQREIDGRPELRAGAPHGDEPARSLLGGAMAAGPDWESRSRAPACADLALSLRGSQARADAEPSCTDPDGDAFTLSTDTAPRHGTASVTAAGSIAYVPDGSGGADRFTFRATDTRGAVSAPAVATVEPDPVPAEQPATCATDASLCTSSVPQFPDSRPFTG